MSTYYSDNGCRTLYSLLYSYLVDILDVSVAFYNILYSLVPLMPTKLTLTLKRQSQLQQTTFRFLGVFFRGNKT